MVVYKFCLTRVTHEKNRRCLQPLNKPFSSYFKIFTQPKIPWENAKFRQEESISTKYNKVKNCRIIFFSPCNFKMVKF